jgi:hypothetical protein
MKKLFFCLLVISITSAFAQMPSYVPQNGLQGYWPFTGNANDIGPNSYGATVVGPQLTNDRFGNNNSAYLFDGISNYIYTNYTGIQGSSSRAVSFWAKSISTNPINVVSWGSNTQGNRFGCMFNYAGIGVTVEGAYSAVTYAPPIPAYDGKWHHYVFQFSTGVTNMVDIYQDAVLLTSIVSTYMPNIPFNTISGYNVTFGRLFVPGGDLFFDGSIDDIGIWDRKLTMCEIFQLFLSTNISQGPITNTLTCAGTPVTFGVLGATDYTWSAVNTGSALVSNPTTNTLYTVAVTNTNTGCAATYTFVHNVYPAITAVASKTAICKGQSIQYSLTGATNYTWSNGGTGSSQTYTPSVSGVLTINATNTVTGCSKLFSFTQQIDNCIGIAENEQSKISIAPNPIQNEFTVHAASEIIFVAVFDALGNRVVHQMAAGTAVTVPCADLNGGIYFAKVYLVNGQTITQKVIIQP